MPNARTALLQTVGWETLPAVTAALALRPAAVGHVHMPDSRDASRRAADAIGVALPGTKVLHLEAGRDDPLVEAREAVRALAEEFTARHGCERIIVHVTGSTKLLAIGLAGCLIAQSVYSLFDAVSFGAKTHFFFWYLFALIFALSVYPEIDPRSHTKKHEV